MSVVFRGQALPKTFEADRPEARKLLVPRTDAPLPAGGTKMSTPARSPVGSNDVVEDTRLSPSKNTPNPLPETRLKQSICHTKPI